MKKFIAKATFECKNRKPSQFEVFAADPATALEKAEAAIRSKYLDRKVAAAVTVEAAVTLTGRPVVLHKPNLQTIPHHTPEGQRLMAMLRSLPGVKVINHSN